MFKIKNNNKTNIKSELLNVKFNRDFNYLPQENISEIVDIYEQYVREREVCDKYKINININVFASNILANRITQLRERTGDGEIYKDYTNISDSDYTNIIERVNDDTYEYLIGYDIFDNYNYRLDTFKINDNGLSNFRGTNDLYDLKTFENSVRDNLIKTNGWLGVINKTKIGNKKVFSSLEPNEIVDLFPTRDYFYFKPIKRGDRYINN